MDPITIGLLVGAGMGALKGNKSQKDKVAQDKYRKMAIAMSPWTGMADPGRLDAPDMLSSTISGAGQGAMVGNSFAPAAAAPGAAGAATPAVNTAQMAPAGAQMSPQQWQKWMLMNQAQGGTGEMMVG